jgi:hypothetical protein
MKNFFSRNRGSSPWLPSGSWRRSCVWGNRNWHLRAFRARHYRAVACTGRPGPVHASGDHASYSGALARPFRQDFRPRRVRAHRRFILGAFAMIGPWYSWVPVAGILRWPAAICCASSASWDLSTHMDRPIFFRTGYNLGAARNVFPGGPDHALVCSFPVLLFLYPRCPNSPNAACSS